MSLDGIKFSVFTGLPIMVSKYCLYKFSFCDVAPYWGHKNTRHSVDNVLDELDFLDFEKGLHKVSFLNELFNRKGLGSFLVKLAPL